MPCQQIVNNQNSDMWKDKKYKVEFKLFLGLSCPNVRYSSLQFELFFVLELLANLLCDGQDEISGDFLYGLVFFFFPKNRYIGK